MKRQLCSFLFIFLFILLYFSQTSYSIYTRKIIKAKQTEPQFSPTRLIVKLKPEVDKKVSLGKVGGKVVTGVAFLDTLNVRFKVKRQERLFGEFKKTALKVDRLSSIYTLEVPQGTDLKSMKEEYEQRPEVEYVELDYKVELFEEPNDPLFAHQWYLNNLGAAQNGGQGYYGINRPAGHTLVMKFGITDADIDALEAFQRTDEKVIPLVGIIDTGVDLDHEDLASNIWVNPGEDLNGNGTVEPSEVNGLDDDHNGFVDDFYGWDFSGDEDNIIEDNDPTDTYGHGTHCAGIVAAVRDNSLGVSGINTPCRIMAIKFFPYAFMSLGAKAIIYAADMGCDVINMSWGSPYPSSVVEEALDYAISKGVLPIAAAGNSGAEDNLYPAAYPQVFTIGASNSKDEVTYFSTYGEHIEVVAPGEDILSLRADNTDMYAPEYPLTHIINSKYYLADGTSMASPCAVGVAAYILSASPGISNDSVISIMEQSADDIIYPYGGDSLYSPGKDIYSGYGRVNLNSALELLSGRLAKIDYPYENAVVSGNIAIIGTASGANFVSYTLEYGEGYSPTTWTEIISSTTPVTKDTLGMFITSGLSGLYTVRLTVGDQNQAVVHIMANSNAYVKITSPQEDDTIQGYTQISGYTIIPDFSYYTLEYGQGDEPSSWIPIDSSTKMVADYILGNWLVSFLVEGTYTLRLTTHSNSEETYADSITLFVKSITSGGWIQDLPSYGSLSPAVGDIDGDGYDEVVVGIGLQAGTGELGGVEVFSHNGQREAGWPKDTDKDMFSSPALGDLDNDGIDDIVICSNLGVHAYLFNSSNNWFRSAGTGANELFGLATPVIADLDNDGYAEVLTISSGGALYAWYNDGESVIPVKNGVFAQTGIVNAEMNFPSLAVADLDKDGENEVIAGTANFTGSFGHYFGEGGIYIWDENANPLLQPGDYPDTFSWVNGIAIADVDADGESEIIALGVTGNGNSFNTLSAYKKDGTQASGFPIKIEGATAGWWFGNHPAVGDLDGDGTLEIVVTMWTPGEARIYAWHQDGTPLVPQGPLVSIKSPNTDREKQVLSTLGNNIGEVIAKLKSMNKEELNSLVSTFQDNVFASVTETFGNPILADVNEDGNVDIIVRAGYFVSSGYERVFAWDYEGNLTPGFPIYASTNPSWLNYLPYSPVMADINKNGKLNMILATDWPDQKLVSWEFETNYDTTKTPWPKYRQDKWNSARYGFSPPVGIPDLSPTDFHVKNWGESSVTLAWKPKPCVLNKGYNIYRSTTSGDYTQPPINSTLIPREDSLYEDTGLDENQTYYYVIANVDLNDNQSDFSKEVRFTLFDTQILLIDLTKGRQENRVNGDSVNAFYGRALDGYGYTYVSPFDSSQDIYSSLGYLSNYPLLIVHSEDFLIQWADLSLISPVLKEYFEAGGCLIIEGRRNLTDDNQSFGTRVFSPGSFTFDCLGIDSAFIPLWDRYHRTEEFIGAHSLDGNYPEVVLDTARVNGNGYSGYVTVLKGKLPGVGYFFPSDLSDMLYAFNSSDAGSFSNGQAVAIKRLGSESGIFYFDFPLFFVREDIATQILHQAISELEVYIDVNDEKEEKFVPTEFVLEQNYPNPFNSETVIRYALSQDCQVKVDIYDILGRKVITLIDEYQSRGFKRITWDGKDKNGNNVASGMYFCRIKAGSFAQAKKMLLLK
ncbi:MAG TPA: S8 family serine peptidase [candidate division Zixibacteria bacterium]